MTKITMKEVYRKLLIALYDEMDESRKFERDSIRLDFKDFSKILRAGDFITTVPTLKCKWDSAIADEVIMTIGNEKYGRALLDIKAFDRKIGYAPSAKNVCVCVCNTDTAEGNTEEARA